MEKDALTCTLVTLSARQLSNWSIKQLLVNLSTRQHLVNSSTCYSSTQIFILSSVKFSPNRSIRNYCCPPNFKSARFLYPQCPSIGIADFVFEKQAPFKLSFVPKVIPYKHSFTGTRIKFNTVAQSC